MPHFFNNFNQRQTPEKQLLSALKGGNSVLANFPLNYPLPSFYAPALLMLNGMAISIVPDSASIQYNLSRFKAAGWNFPEICFLDGSQMPHEERAIRDAINRNRIRILYITPERFSSLTFLELFVRSSVSFLMIEEADRFLPDNPDFARYERLRSQGLAAIRSLPPVVLLTAPMRMERQKLLIQRLGFTLDHQLSSREAKPITLIETALPTAHVAINVVPLWSEHQKFERLIAYLSGNPVPGRIGHLHKQNPVLIQAGDAAQSEKLGASLVDYGFESVYIVNRRQSLHRQQHAWQLAQEKPDAIIVNGNQSSQDWKPSHGLSRQVIYWRPPNSLDSLTASLFRYIIPDAVDQKSAKKNTTTTLAEDLSFMDEEVPQSFLSKVEINPTLDVLIPQSIQSREARIEALILYTREDYSHVIQNIRQNQQLSTESKQERILALKRFRHWVLSGECRVTNLLQHSIGDTDELEPCGNCDRCQSAKHGGKLIQFIQKVLF